jgi:hypothetical protein
LGVADVSASKLALYPNPVKDVLNIQGSTFKIENAKIYDASGKLVKTFDGNTVNVSGLQKGEYLVSVEDKNGVTTMKFIKK